MRLPAKTCFSQKRNEGPPSTHILGQVHPDKKRDALGVAGPPPRPAGWPGGPLVATVRDGPVAGARDRVAGCAARRVARRGRGRQGSRGPPRKSRHRARVFVARGRQRQACATKALTCCTQGGRGHAMLRPGCSWVAGAVMRPRLGNEGRASGSGRAHRPARSPWPRRRPVGAGEVAMGPGGSPGPFRARLKSGRALGLVPSELRDQVLGHEVV